MGNYHLNTALRAEALATIGLADPRRPLGPVELQLFVDQASDEQRGRFIREADASNPVLSPFIDQARQLIGVQQAFGAEGVGTIWEVESSSSFALDDQVSGTSLQVAQGKRQGGDQPTALSQLKTRIEENKRNRNFKPDYRDIDFTQIGRDELKEIIKRDPSIFDNANLTFCDLSGKDFVGANLHGTNFHWAKLFGANFAGATIVGADFSGAKLSGADFSGGDFSNVNFSGATMVGADFSGAILSESSFSRATLVGANFSWAHLSKTNLTEVDLSGADFSGTTLSVAYLVGATLSGATLFGTDLTRVNSLRKVLDFKGAFLWHTVLPPEVAFDESFKEKLETAQLVHVVDPSGKPIPQFNNSTFSYADIQPFLAAYLPEDLMSILDQLALKTKPKILKSFLMTALSLTYVYKDEMSVYTTAFLTKLNGNKNKIPSKMLKQFAAIAKLPAGKIVDFYSKEMSSFTEDTAHFFSEKSIKTRKRAFLAQELKKILGSNKWNTSYLSQVSYLLQATTPGDGFFIFFSFWNTIQSLNWEDVVLLFQMILDRESEPLKQIYDDGDKLKGQEKEAQYLYHYIRGGGPDMIEVWKWFLSQARTDLDGAKDNLKELVKSGDKILYGREAINPNDEQSLLAAYLALGRPMRGGSPYKAPALTFAYFKEKIKRLIEEDQIKPPFLRDTIVFDLDEVVGDGSQIDTGLLSTACEAVMEAGDIKEAFNAFWKEHGKNNALQALAEQHLGLDNAGLPDASDISKLTGFVTSVVDHESLSGNQDLQAALVSLILAITSEKIDTGEEEGTLAKLKAYNKKLKSTPTPAEHQEALLALYAFYHNSIPEIFPHVSTWSPQLVDFQRQISGQYKQQVQQKIGEEKQKVELIPSSDPLDHFIMGYVGEDCLRKGEKALKHDHFMIYRIVIDGRLEGAMYLWKDQHAQETDAALLMVIALRRRAQVDYKGLVAGIEKAMPAMLQDAKAKVALISTNTNLMGNNPNVAGAVQTRWEIDKVDRKVAPDVPRPSYYPGAMYVDGEYYVVARNEGTDPPVNSGPEGDPSRQDPEGNGHPGFNAGQIADESAVASSATASLQIKLIILMANEAFNQKDFETAIQKFQEALTLMEATNVDELKIQKIKTDLVLAQQLYQKDFSFSPGTRTEEGGPHLVERVVPTRPLVSQRSVMDASNGLISSASILAGPKLLALADPQLIEDPIFKEDPVNNVLAEEGRDVDKLEEPRMDVLIEDDKTVDVEEVDNATDVMLESEGNEDTSGGIVESAHRFVSAGVPKPVSPAMGARMLIH